MGGLATKHNVSKVLMKHQELSRYVPETRFYDPELLRTMLQRYKMVYVKPNNGTGGRGILRAEKTENGYRYQFKTKVHIFRTFQGMVQSMKQLMKDTPYVVQQGIHLLKHKGRAFDLRIMVQVNPRGEWETTGILGRVSHPDKIVTNLARGGVAVSIETLMKERVSDLAQFKSRLYKFGERASRHLHKAFPRIKELGLDIALDRDLKIWILEANPRPAIYGFKDLKDKSIYRKIYRYHKAYGDR